ncbi:MAG: AMP-binding protein, partial [Acidobacteria bacterium]|nr:AMP-binding protein [Acidobacteriota bacterium]
ISGSAPLLEPTFAAFEQRTGFPILERYGLTEAGIVTSNPVEGPRIAGTVGRALPGISVRVADEAGNPLPPDQVGEIQVLGDNVFVGYWRKPEETAASFTPDGFFKTGDLGRWCKDGSLSVVGRSKEMIITGGLNVYPKEIESALDQMEGIAESAVIGVPHPDFGEGVVAVVARKPGWESLTEAALMARLKELLANYKVPKRIFFVDELPRNAMGKVQKNLLRSQPQFVPTD